MSGISLPQHMISILEEDGAGVVGAERQRPVVPFIRLLVAAYHGVGGR